VWPETQLSLTLAGKKPGAGWEPESQELAFTQRSGEDMRPYDRLIGAALDADRWLFARQDTVEARGSWGPEEADRLLPDRDTWHDPAG
jgi:glucose-6-phosphate 1-dehydrogenase